MEEIFEFCQRLLGPGEAAARVAREVTQSEAEGPVALLQAASRACRAHAVASPGSAPDMAIRGEGLGAAVGRELAAACARLPERQREALALRESCGLSYEQLSEVIGIGAATAGALLARSRLRLRDELRGASHGSGIRPPDCEHRDRALRALARRQDSELLAESEANWLAEHVGDCESCGQAHAAMLEASVCYRAWELHESPPLRVPDAAGELVGVRPGTGASEDPSEPVFTPALPPLWRRFRAALAADARR